MADQTSLVQNAGSLAVREVTTPASAGVQQVISQADPTDGSLRKIRTTGAGDVNLASSQGNQPNVSAALTGNGATVVANVGTSGNGTIVLAGGTYTNLPIAFEGSIDNTNWFPIDATRSDRSYFEITATIATAGVYAWNYIAPGYLYVRVRQTGTASTQTANPTVWITQGPFLYDPSPVVGLAQPQTGTITSVTAVTTTATILAANPRRKHATIFNDSTAYLYLALASGATTSLFTIKMDPGGYYEVPPQDGSCVGIITGVWSAVNGAARVTELI